MTNITLVCYTCKKFKSKGGIPSNIYYVGSKGDGARIYYRFVPNKFKVEILAYSNKGKQTAITKRMERLYDN